MKKVIQNSSLPGGASAPANPKFIMDEGVGVVTDVTPTDESFFTEGSSDDDEDDDDVSFYTEEDYANNPFLAALRDALAEDAESGRKEFRAAQGGR